MVTKLRAHLESFVTTYNFADLKTYKFICKRWTIRLRKVH